MQLLNPCQSVLNFWNIQWVDIVSSSPCTEGLLSQFLLRWKLACSLSLHITLKFRKQAPGAYIFQRPFLRVILLEGLTLGGAYTRKEICVTKWIGLAYGWREIYVSLYYFCFLLFCIWRQSPPESYIRKGDLTEGLLCYEFEGNFSEFHGITFL